MTPLIGGRGFRSLREYGNFMFLCASRIAVLAMGAWRSFLKSECEPGSYFFDRWKDILYLDKKSISYAKLDIATFGEPTAEPAK